MNKKTKEDRVLQVPNGRFKLEVTICDVKLTAPVAPKEGTRRGGF